jgi:hypothetical protein
MSVPELRQSSRSQVLDILNQNYARDPNSFSPAMVEQLEGYNLTKQDDPGYFESQGFLKDSARTIGQIPTGFFEGFTTINADFIEPRSQSEKIARSIGSLLGFVGYIPNPSAIALQVAGRIGGKKAVSKMIAKKYSSKFSKEALQEISELSLKELQERFLKDQAGNWASTNALKGAQIFGKQFTSIPMMATNAMMEAGASKKFGASAMKLLNSSKYLKIDNKFLNPEFLGGVGQGMMHLGLASGVSALGINPFQMQERIHEVAPAMLHGMAYGGAFKGIGQIGTAMNGALASGSPKTAQKILQGVAGSIIQGLPSTMRGDEASMQVYEYLLGAYFGAHETPWQQRKGAKKVADVSKDMINEHSQEASVLYRARPEEFAKKYELDKLDPVTRKVVDDMLKRQFDADPRNMDSVVGEFNAELEKENEAIRGRNEERRKREIPKEEWEPELSASQRADTRYGGFTTITNEHGQREEIPVFHRDPFSDVPIKNGAYYNSSEGYMVIDAPVIQKNIKKWMKEGVPSTKEVPGFNSSVLTTEAQWIDFYKNHEAYHSIYGSEHLATALALRETLSKTLTGYEMLGKDPMKEFPLFSKLNPAEKAEFEHHVLKFEAEKHVAGDKIEKNGLVGYASYKNGKRINHRGYVVGYDEATKNVYIKEEVRDGVGKYSVSEDVISVYQGMVDHTFPGRVLKGKKLHDTFNERVIDGKLSAEAREKLEKAKQAHDKILKEKDETKPEPGSDTSALRKILDQRKSVKKNGEEDSGASDVSALRARLAEREAKPDEEIIKTTENYTREELDEMPPEWTEEANRQARDESTTPEVPTPEVVHPPEQPQPKSKGTESTPTPEPVKKQPLTPSRLAKIGEQMEMWTKNEPVETENGEEWTTEMASEAHEYVARFPSHIRNKTGGEPETTAQAYFEAEELFKLSKNNEEFVAEMELLYPGHGDEAGLYFTNKGSIRNLKIENGRLSADHEESRNSRVMRELNPTGEEIVMVDPSMLDALEQRIEIYKKALEKEGAPKPENLGNVKEHTLEKLIAEGTGPEATIIRDSLKAQGIELDYYHDMGSPVGKYGRMLIRISEARRAEIDALKESADPKAQKAIKDLIEVARDEAHTKFFEDLLQKPIIDWANEGLLTRGEKEAWIEGLRKTFGGNEELVQKTVAEWLDPSLNGPIEEKYMPKNADGSLHYAQKSKIDKALKYIGQFLTPASYSHKDTPFKYVVINDGAWIKKLTSNSAYSKFVENGLDGKPRSDGAIFVSEAMLERLKKTFGLEEKMRNFKPVVTHRDTETLETFVGKGQVFTDPLVEAYMKEHGIEVMFLDTSAKLRSGEENGQIVGKRSADDGISFDRIATFKKGMEKDNLTIREMPESAIGFIKGEKTDGKGKSSVTIQMLDTVMDASVSNSFVKTYIDPMVRDYEAFEKSIKDKDKAQFIDYMLEDVFNVKRDPETKTITHTGSEKADKYIKRLLAGENPFGEHMREQTYTFARKMILNIAKPSTKSGEYAYIRPDLGYTVRKINGEYVKVQTFLKERRIVKDPNGDNILTPGDAIMPANWARKKMLPKDMWVFDNVTNTYMRMDEAYPDLNGVVDPMRVYDLWMRSKKGEKHKNYPRYDMIFMYQSSPKQKPEDTLILRMHDFHRKDNGSAIEVNTIDASIAAERDWDGDAGGTSMVIPKEFLKEVTQNVLDKEGDFRVGRADPPGASNTEMRITERADYHKLNSKVTRANARVGEVVNRKSEYNAILNAGLGIEAGGVSVTPLSRDSSADRHYTRLYAEETQTVVDAIKSELGGDLVSQRYTSLARERAFEMPSEELSKVDEHVRRGLIKALITPFANAIKFSNPKNFEQNSKNSALFDVWQAKNEYMALKEAGSKEGLEFGGRKFTQEEVIGLIWWKQNYKTYRKYVGALAKLQKSNPKLSPQAIKKMVLYPEKANYQTLQFRALNKILSQSEEFHVNKLPQRLRDMLVDPNTSEQSVGKSGKLRIPKLGISGDLLQAPKMKVLEKIETDYPSFFDNYSSEPVAFSRDYGQMHSLERSRKISKRRDALLHNETIMEVITDRDADLIDRLKKDPKLWGKRKNSSGMEEKMVAVGWLPKLILKKLSKNSPEIAKNLAEIWMLRYARSQFAGGNDPFNQQVTDKRKDDARKRYHDFMNLHDIGRLLGSKSKDADIKLLEKYRNEFGEYDLVAMDERMMELFEADSSSQIYALLNPTSNFNMGSGKSTNSQHHNFLAPSGKMWDVFLSNPDYAKYNEKFEAVKDQYVSEGNIKWYRTTQDGINSQMNKLHGNKHDFPWGTNDPIHDVTDVDFSNATRPMTPGQKAFFKNIFAEVPGLGHNFGNVLMDLIGKRRFDNHKEIDHVIQVLDKHMSGKPQLGVIQRMFMPELLSRKFMDFDAIYQDKEMVGLGDRIGLSGTSSFGQVFNRMVKSKTDEQKEEAIVQEIINGIIYNFELPDHVAKRYGLEEGGSMLNKDEIAYKEAFKRLVKDSSAKDIKKIYHLATMMYEYEYAVDQLTKSMEKGDAERLKIIKKRYDDARKDFDSLDHNGGEIKQRYVRYLMRQMDKFYKHMYKSYHVASSGNKYSVHRTNQRNMIYDLPQYIKKLEVEMGEIKKSKLSASKKEVALRAIVKKINGAKSKYSTLKRYEALGQVYTEDQRIAPRKLDGYTHHYYRNLEQLEMAFEAFKEAELEKHGNYIAKKHPKNHAKQKAYMEKKEADLEAMRMRTIESQVSPPGRTYEEKAPGEWSMMTSKSSEMERIAEMGGYETDVPSVMMKYAKQVLHKSVIAEGGRESREVIDRFKKKMTAKWGNDPEAQKQVERLEEFMHSYLKDNMGYFSELTKFPKIHKYVWARLTGKDPNKAPEDYEANISDVYLLDKLNAKRAKKGKKPLPVWQASAWANMEAKYEYLTLLTHPKYSIGNFLGGTINTVVYGGLKRFSQANEMLKDPQFIKKMETQGLMPELMAYEFDVAFGGSKVNWGGYGETLKKIITDPNMTLKEKKVRIAETTQDSNVGKKAIELASTFGTPVENHLRKKAFTVGWIMAEEMQLTGEDQVDFARRFVTSTQYLYHNAVRPEFARSSLGKVMTRFMMYFFSTMSFQKNMAYEAKKWKVTPESEEHKRMQRWIGMASVMMSLASLYPYSIFDSALAPHLDIMKDTTELLMGDEKDKAQAFFGTYGLNVFTAPMLSRMVLRPLVTIANQDYQRYLNREMYSWFPFGRFAKSAVTTLKNPYYSVQSWTGIPQMGFAQDGKKISESRKKGEDGYMHPGKRTV